MKNCPVCNAPVNEKAKFCAECGSQLSKAASERAWIIAMQERIKSARHSDVLYYIIAVVGILIAVVIPFVMRYVLLQNMTMTGWLITAAGIVLLIGSIFGMWFDNSKIKDLIEQLEAGPQEEDEEEEKESEGETEEKKAGD